MIEIKSHLNRRMTNEEARNLLDELLQKIDPMSGKAVELLRMGDVVDEAKTKIPKPGEIVGLSTGYKEVDWMTGGLELGEVSVWYGGTSSGKSQITQNIALNMAMRGIPILKLPLEMGVYLNTARLLKMYGEDKEQEFRQLPIYYPDSKRMDISTLANTVAEAKSNLGIQAVVVDQLQQLVPRQGTNLVETISATTDELHKIADESQVHILLISHINRSGAQAGPPSLQELKGSASIEQDADICISLYRNTEDEDLENAPDYRAPLQLLQTKNRNRGGAGKFKSLRVMNNMRLLSMEI